MTYDRARGEIVRFGGWDTPNHLDTLALALFENGDVDGAIEAQERAIALQGDDVSDSFRERLARYRGESPDPGKR